MDELSKRFDDLEILIKDQSLYRKEALTFSEGCRYCGFMPSYMHKLTGRDAIPYYKPNGKMIYFRRSDLDDWLLRNRNTTGQEMQEEGSAKKAEKGRAQS
jgi:hypothetical protein